MHTAKEQEAMDLASAVLPADESEEDRELRRQMLQYGMSEIGPVVAELELEEGDSDDDFSYDETDEDDSEDELGRSKTSVITDDYIQRMKELEKRLGVQSAFTAEPHQPKTELPEGGIGRIAVRPPEHSPPEVDGEVSSKSGHKSVKFAADVPDDKSKEPKVNPLGDVLERGNDPTPQPAANSSAPAKRPSRFKKERAGSSAPPQPSGLPQGPHQVPARFREGISDEVPKIPTGPDGKVIVDALVEREVSSTPKNPDEFDGELLYQAASVEYNRLKNREIKRQGGFMKEDESPISPPEENDEATPRVSRFMAARLARK